VATRTAVTAHTAIIAAQESTANGKHTVLRNRTVLRLTSCQFELTR
jgi:hypothetical protein